MRPSSYRRIAFARIADAALARTHEIVPRWLPEPFGGFAFGQEPIGGGGRWGFVHFGHSSLIAVWSRNADPSASAIAELRSAENCDEMRKATLNDRSGCGSS